MKNAFVLIFLSGLFLFVSCKPEKNSPDDLIRHDNTIIYETKIIPEGENYNWMGNLNRTKLLEKILEQIKSGQLKAYDPFFFDKDKPLAWDEVEKNLGSFTDTLDVASTETNEIQQKVVHEDYDLSEIKSLIFIEEWYFDEQNHLQKNLLGLAPVRHIVKSENVSSKRIAFVCYFSDKTPPLFAN